MFARMVLTHPDTGATSTAEFSGPDDIAVYRQMSHQLIVMARTWGVTPQRINQSNSYYGGALAQTKEVDLHPSIAPRC